MNNYRMKVTITIYNNYKFDKKHLLGLHSWCLWMYVMSLSLLIWKDLWLTADSIKEVNKCTLSLCWLKLQLVVTSHYLEKITIYKSNIYGNHIYLAPKLCQKNVQGTLSTWYVTETIHLVLTTLYSEYYDQSHYIEKTWAWKDKVICPSSHSQ